MKSENISPNILNFIVSPTQMAIDQKMVAYDIWATLAHVIMLYKTGILPTEKAVKIDKALKEIGEEYKNWKFSIDPQKGAQLSLEAKIVEKAGDIAGLSAHTGRSRNDQVMVTELLYLKEKLTQTIENVADLVDELLTLSKKHVETVFPGYTHMQPAKPTTFAHWCLAQSDGLLKACDQLIFTYEQYDLCPLGSAESYGTSWPIDRNLTASLLGFSDVWEIPLHAISSRGVFQLAILDGFTQLAIATSKLAADLLLYSTFEFGLVSFGENVSQRLHPVTGSSIMAQKKNPDTLELVRSTAPQITGLYQAVAGLLTALPSGYNRDTREIKEYIEIAFTKVNTMLVALHAVISTLAINKKRALELVKSNYSLTTEVADFLSQKSHAPYRLIYKIVGQAVDEAIKLNKPIGSITASQLIASARELGVDINISDDDLKEALDPSNALEKKKHIGGTNSQVTNTLILKRIAKSNKLKQWVVNKSEKTSKSKKKTFDMAEAMTKGESI